MKRHIPIDNTNKALQLSKGDIVWMSPTESWEYIGTHGTDYCFTVTEVAEDE